MLQMLVSNSNMFGWKFKYTLLQNIFTLARLNGCKGTSMNVKSFLLWMPLLREMTNTFVKSSIEVPLETVKWGAS